MRFGFHWPDSVAEDRIEGGVCKCWSNNEFWLANKGVV